MTSYTPIDPADDARCQALSALISDAQPEEVKVDLVAEIANETRHYLNGQLQRLIIDADADSQTISAWADSLASIERVAHQLQERSRTSPIDALSRLGGEIDALCDRLQALIAHLETLPAGSREP